jgi:hypothetical protein
MVRRQLSLAVVTLALAAAGPAAASAAGSSALIKGEEVGYFGSATVTHTVSVFVYSDRGPAAGNHVTICLEGTCEPARGHNARLAWYSASFRTRGLHMGDAVRFSVLATEGGRHAKLSVTRDLLCMHNNGSTPQS